MDSSKDAIADLLETEVLQVGVDIGGTFTDITIVGAAGAAYQIKVPSSPPHFSHAVIAGLQRLLERSALPVSAVAKVLHGTTVATNALLEMRGATTGLLTTRGFRDVLELGRMRRPTLYDISWQKPAPLVPRRRRLEVDERINARGEIEQALDEVQTLQQVEALLARGADSLAVCLLNSYLNPIHEKRIVELVQANFPDLHVSASFQILPEIKEYERTSTTVVNAYVHPVVDRYLADLQSGLHELGVTCPLLIMQSSGGLVNAAIARKKPVQMIESGPAAGVMAVSHLARRLSLPNVIAFDMGGTTAKASLIENGRAFEASEYEVGGDIHAQSSLARGGGYAIRVPSIDIAEVGAGGGSIFWRDEGGAARVGPQSSGATPGPACYGRGGALATITDAAVVLGYLSPVSLAGGSQLIDFAAAHRVIQEQVAQPLNLSLEEAAHGIYRIAIANMSTAVRAVTSQRGRDPRDFTLVAFGGAGPLHAVEMAREFGIENVLIPVSSGLFSTLGLLVADVQHSSVFSYTRRGDMDVTEINATFAHMENQLRDEMESEGYAPDAICTERVVDMRYTGQSFELHIPVGGGVLSAGDLEQMRASFDEEHKRTYGHGGKDQSVEIINLRVRATYPGLELQWGSFASHDVAVSAQSRPAYFGREHGVMETPILTRRRLGTKATDGPLLIEDMDATILVPPRCQARCDEWGNVLVEINE